MMDEYKLIRPYEKILNYRNLLKMTQEQLANGEVDRSLISLIETGKQPLTVSTAKILIRNLNEFCIKNGIKMQKIKLEEILEEDSVQIERITASALNKLDVFGRCEIEEGIIKKFYGEQNKINKFINEYRDYMPKEVICEIFGKVAEIHYSKTFSYEEYYYYSNLALENAFSCKECREEYVLKYRIERIYALLLLGELTEVEREFKYIADSIANAQIKDKSIIDRLYYIYILALREMRKYKECIKTIEYYYKKIYSNESYKTYINIIECVIYTRMNPEQANFYKARKTYESVIAERTKSKSTDELALLYAGYAELEIRAGNVERGERYMERSAMLRVEGNQTIILFRKKFFLVANIIKNDFKYVYREYKRALNKSIEIDHIYVQRFLIKELFNFFMQYDAVYIEEFLRFMKEKIAANKINPKIYLEIMTMCYKATYSCNSKQIVEMGTEILGMIEENYL